VAQSALPAHHAGRIRAHPESTIFFMPLFVPVLVLLPPGGGA
jgi:hypothetical protein